jgi:hypothetical protein
MLTSYEFPSHILTGDVLTTLHDESRLEHIRRSILAPKAGGSMIRYLTGSPAPETIPPQSIDLIISQAVLEYVEPLLDTYRLMYRWLCQEGFASHEIGFGCHGWPPSGMVTGRIRTWSGN